MPTLKSGNPYAEVTVRMFITLPIFALQIGLLAGCATPAQEAAYAQRDMERMITVYGPACEKLGYSPNTDPWRNCVMQLSYKNEIQRYSFSVSPYWAF